MQYVQYIKHRLLISNLVRNPKTERPINMKTLFTIQTTISKDKIKD